MYQPRRISIRTQPKPENGMAKPSNYTVFYVRTQLEPDAVDVYCTYASPQCKEQDSLVCWLLSNHSAIKPRTVDAAVKVLLLEPTQPRISGSLSSARWVIGHLLLLVWTPVNVQKHLSDDQEKWEGTWAKFQVLLIIYCKRIGQYFLFYSFANISKSLFSLCHYAILNIDE